MSGLKSDPILGTTWDLDELPSQEFVFHPLTPWSSRTLPVPVRFEARGFDGTGVPKNSDEKRVIRIRASKKDVGSSWLRVFFGYKLFCTPKYCKITMWKSPFGMNWKIFFGRNPPRLPSQNDQKPAGTGCFNTREFRFTLDLRKDDVAWNLSSLIYHGFITSWYSHVFGSLAWKVIPFSKWLITWVSKSLK